MTNTIAKIDEMMLKTKLAMILENINKSFLKDIIKLM